MSALSNFNSDEQLIFSGYPREAPALPLVFGGLGICHLQEHVDRPGGIDLWQWIQCTKGCGELILDEQLYTVEEGCGILLPPKTSHIYYGLDLPWYVNFLGFTGACAQSVMEALGLDRPGVYRLSKPQEILSQEQQLYDIHLRAPENAAKTSKQLYNLLLDLSMDITRTASGSNGTGNTRVHRAICFIYEHYMEGISLEDIADSVSLSREYLCQLFKKHTHVTVLDYLVQTRIAAAKTQLIKYPGKTIAEISGQCGFETPSYFCAVFKKYEGQTPGEFRKTRR